MVRIKERTQDFFNLSPKWLLAFGAELLMTPCGMHGHGHSTSKSDIPKIYDLLETFIVNRFVIRNLIVF
jgi:hypothetical protein